MTRSSDSTPPDVGGDQMCSTDEAVTWRVRKPTTPRVYPARILCALTIVAIATVLFAGYHNTSDWTAAATKVGGYREIQLADGSVVHLNTNTELLYHFTTARRELVLTRGEARFKVAHDTQRPFVVQAKDTVVRAVGTEFNIRVRDAADVDVSVIEGVVSVSHHAERPMMLRAVGLPLADTSGGTTLVAAHAVHDVAGRLTIVPRSDAENRFEDGWLRGRVIFEGDPLADVVREVNRYSAQQIHIVDPSIAHIRIGGSYKRGDDVRVFLQGLASVAPVESREVPRRDLPAAEFELYRAHREVIPPPPSERLAPRSARRR